MPRILGIDLPKEKRIEAALPYIYGVGRVMAEKIVAVTGVDPNKRVKDITDAELAKLQKEVEKYGFLGIPVTVVEGKAVKGFNNELQELIEAAKK